LVQRLVIGDEVLERAVLVALRDVGLGEARDADLQPPAVAAHHATDAVLLGWFPAGIVTNRAGHRRATQQNRGAAMKTHRHEDTQSRRPRPFVEPACLRAFMAARVSSNGIAVSWIAAACLWRGSRSGGRARATGAGDRRFPAASAADRLRGRSAGAP